MAFLTNATILLILACVSHQLVLTSKKTYRQTRSLQPIRGKMVTKDKSECTWAATGDDTFTMGVTCKKGGNRISCDYIAKPKLCPSYSTNQKLFWKQIARALRKQKNLCGDSNALVKAAMCRKAPREAHFQLGVTHRSPNLSSTPSPPPRTVKSCQPANKKLAKEYCANSWSSFCTFFFTMVKDYDC